jgi:cytochrome P450
VALVRGRSDFPSDTYPLEMISRGRLPLSSSRKENSQMNTRPPVTDWSTDFDHLDPLWVEDPYPIWDELRKKCPVAHTNRFRGVYFPTRYRDVRAIAHDTEHFSSRRVVVREQQQSGQPAPPINSDPPEHHAHKMVLLPAFTRKAVERYKPQTREVCRRLIARALGKRSFDASAEYAQEIPATAISLMLGIPATVEVPFARWLREFMEFGTLDPARLARVNSEMIAFFAGEIAKRRESPADDLVSYLLQARMKEELLNDGQVNGILRLLLMAGVDTTSSAIACSLWHLACHPEDRIRLVASPSLIPTAVEEFLRAYSPVTMAREVVKDAEIDGYQFKQGEMVMLSFPAANRDPDVFPNADRVIIDRQVNRHAAFGIGIHKCLGSHLARMEIGVALEEWLAHIPDFRLDPSASFEWTAGAVRGPRNLPILIG